MKRCGDIFEKIVDINNLRLAHQKARKGKRHYKEVQIIDKNVDYYLSEVKNMLENGSFTTSAYDVYTIKDRGKEREIHKLPYYPDRIIQWAIMLQIEEVFIKHFIYDTYAAIPKRGMHLALKRLHNSMDHREDTKYCLKIDVKKFFPNINTAILKQMIRKKFKDKDLLWLLDDIIDSCKGVPIGNYTSQYFGNFYLSYFDHWMKEEKKIKHYFRYMDDVIILHHDKNFLHQIRREIEIYLHDNLNLILKENWQVFPTYVRGVDFVGYRSFGDYTLLRKSTAKNLKRKMRKIQKRNKLNKTDVNSVMSYKGWIKHCNSYNLETKYIKPLLRRCEDEVKKYGTT